MLFRAADGRELSGFARASVTPSDRNQIGLYIDGGLTFQGLFSGRPDDILGMAFSYARISSQARDLDRDARLLGGAGPIRSSEALVEITYRAQIVPGWTLQPDFQYVIRPGGRIADPRAAAGSAIRNAIIVGLRSSIRY